jgi:hypothetical protein
VPIARMSSTYIAIIRFLSTEMKIKGSNLLSVNPKLIMLSGMQVGAVVCVEQTERID